MMTPKEAAAKVFRDAYALHPVTADTWRTYQAARQAAQDAGATFIHASNIAINAWDEMVAQVQAEHCKVCADYNAQVDKIAKAIRNASPLHRHRFRNDNEGYIQVMAQAVLAAQGTPNIYATIDGIPSHRGH